MLPIRPIDAPKFAYNGGKANLRRFIVRWLPLFGTTYVEPFAGRGNVFWLMRILGSFDRYHLNDIRTAKFYSSLLKYNGEPLVVPIYGTIISEWLNTVPDHVADILEPLLCWAGGVYSSTKKAYPDGTRNVAKLQLTVERARDLLNEVRITSIDALDIIERYAGDPSCVMYLDPPYLGANVQAYSDKDLDWGKFYSLLKCAKCTWVMSEYQHAQHDSELGLPQVFYSTKVKAGGKSRPVKEVLYSNRKLEGPSVIDFQEVVISPQRTRKLFRAGDVLTVNEIYNRMPRHWSPKNCSLELALLQKYPYVYWDGEKLSFLEGFS